MPAMVNGPEGGLEWDVVNWRIHESNVERLRRRIFTAARDGDWPKVRKLQKMMLRAWSNTLPIDLNKSQVSAFQRRILKTVAMVPAHDRRSGCCPGPGDAAGPAGRCTAGDRRPVGALPDHRCRRGDRGGGRRGLSPSASRRPVRRGPALLLPRSSPAAPVPP